MIHKTETAGGTINDTQDRDSRRDNQRYTSQRQPEGQSIIHKTETAGGTINDTQDRDSRRDNQ
jgi:thiamine phosphate synthase YjbQ (UPF0047 family)